MIKIMEYKKPDDYLVSTGTGTSVKEFANLVFKEIGINIKWYKRMEKSLLLT